MYKSKLFLVSLMLVCLTVVGSHAQVTSKDLGDEAARLQSAITKAVDAAVFENGKIRSLKVALPNDRERLLTFEHADDQRSFTIVDEGRRIVVKLNEYGRISGVIFPSGKKAVFDWLMMPTGYWVPAAMKVDGKELSRTSSLVDGDGCYDICQTAAAAAAIAIGQCIASGPLSAACAAATATAAYATYRCYRCTNPEIECPPEN